MKCRKIGDHNTNTQYALNAKCPKQYRGQWPTTPRFSSSPAPSRARSSRPSNQRIPTEAPRAARDIVSADCYKRGWKTSGALAEGARGARRKPWGTTRHIGEHERPPAEGATEAVAVDAGPRRGWTWARWERQGKTGTFNHGRCIGEGAPPACGGPRGNA